MDGDLIQTQENQEKIRIQEDSELVNSQTKSSLVWGQFNHFFSNTSTHDS